MFGIVFWSIIMFIGGYRHWTPTAPLGASGFSLLFNIWFYLERTAHPWGPSYSASDYALGWFLATACWFGAYWLGRFVTRRPPARPAPYYETGFRRADRTNMPQAPSTMRTALAIIANLVALVVAFRIGVAVYDSWPFPEISATLAFAAVYGVLYRGIEAICQDGLY